MKFLSGSATALITPFTADGVNFGALEALLAYQIAGGTDAVVILGTTGEPATMTEAEKTEVIRFCVEKVAGRMKVVVGTGSNCTAHAVEATRRAETLGADGVLAVTPYYNKCTQEGVVNYYAAVCAATALPVIAYNVPPRTGVNILPATAERIAAIPNLAGIKEASGNMAQVLETMRLTRGGCDVYSGEDALNLPILLSGGTAVISVVSNLAPRQVKSLTEHALKGELCAARKVSDDLLPLAAACFAEVNPIPVKYGMNLLGFAAGLPRAPLTELSAAHRAPLVSAMKAVGLEVRE